MNGQVALALDQGADQGVEVLAIGLDGPRRIALRSKRPRPSSWSWWGVRAMPGCQEERWTGCL